jgi:capsule polysaccharide export protein KpsE/RkpR
VYKFTKKKKYFFEDVLKELEKNYKISVSNDVGTVSIFMTDKSPVRAAGMANFAVTMLDSINKDLVNTYKGKKREYLEKRMLDNRKDLQLSEDSLIAFQKKHGIFDVAHQAAVSVNAVGGVESQLMAEEVQIATEQVKFSRNVPFIQEQLKDIESKRKYLDSLDSGRNYKILMPLSTIPDEALALERMQRKVVVFDVLDKFLTKEYESARLEEKNTTPTIAVLDPAFVPQKKFKPIRRIIAMTATAIGFILALYLSYVLQRFVTIPSLPAGNGFPHSLMRAAKSLLIRLDIR